MTYRQFFIHRRNTNCQSLENLMKNNYVRIPDRMKLLKQAPPKKKAVFRGPPVSAVHNPRTYFHTSCNKM